MPRKAFLADVGSLSEKPQIKGISHVRVGDEDGQVLFDVEPASNGPKYEITALISDVGDYPNDHFYFLSAVDSTPKHITSALDRLSNAETGQSLLVLLQLLSSKFTQDKDGDIPMEDSQAEDLEEDDEDEVDDFDDDIFGDSQQKVQPGTSIPQPFISPQVPPEFRARIRSDFRRAKSAGFKIGYDGGLIHGLSCYVSISMRIGKLGLSEEAMQAWEVDPNQYLVLVINYPNGYKSFEGLTIPDSATARRTARFRIGISHTYKPSHAEAVKAFNPVSMEEESREISLKSSQEKAEGRGFRNSFISQALNQMFNDRLVQIITYRDTLALTWAGAEEFYNDHQGLQFVVSDSLDGKYFKEEPEDHKFPVLKSDHIADTQVGQTSFPLVAMQFLLRHFIRCTDFCLVCHRKLPGDLEAIKPYVCENPLCLYQYMSLGFGPSIEHEILTQPHVVDLLISFCYSQALAHNKLQNLPVGLGLQVPQVFGRTITNTCFGDPNRFTGSKNLGTASTPPPEVKDIGIAAKFNRTTLELLFEPHVACPLRVGDWIIITQPEHPEMHCRVMSTTFFPTVSVSEPVMPIARPELDVKPSANKEKNQELPVPSGFEAATLMIYDQNFDDLSILNQRETICRLLNALPPVKEMQDYLKSTQKQLRTWVNRISPAAAGVLRWIIASNRACIFQVDDLDASDDKKAKMAADRVHGMPGWMQFRFAMGAPDKERRFLSEVNEVSARLKLTYPTIFAWHGSPLENWHSIIREGLHYNYIGSGRAYGNGVYHSPYSNTSFSYSGCNVPGWPNSRLKISSALALNELVNSPAEYTSMNPHYVVQHLDWIQTRYLFVKVDVEGLQLSDTSRPSEVFQQDTNRQVQGPLGTLIIPANAISRSRRIRSSSKIKTPANKGRRGTRISPRSPSAPIDLSGVEDDESIATDDEDLAILVEEEFSQPLAKKTKMSKPMTDFVPGALDIASLPILQPPSYATPFASKRLLNDFKTLVRVQESTPLHELGWYVNSDPELMSNLYQWIIELHSFDPSLPLAEDLKARKLTSVVLELRFGKDFPHSPPFVRVIRPRFLGFREGGGGHITAGGALCMELLTNNGWSAAQSIESVLLQVKMAMSETEPQPARIAASYRSDYGISEAVEAYERACRVHGWQIPADLRDTTKDMATDDRSI